MSDVILNSTIIIYWASKKWGSALFKKSHTNTTHHSQAGISVYTNLSGNSLALLLCFYKYFIAKRKWSRYSSCIKNIRFKKEITLGVGKNCLYRRPAYSWFPNYYITDRNIVKIVAPIDWWLYNFQSNLKHNRGHFFFQDGAALFQMDFLVMFLVRSV